MRIPTILPMRCIQNEKPAGSKTVLRRIRRAQCTRDRASLESALRYRISRRICMRISQRKLCTCQARFRQIARRTALFPQRFPMCRGHLKSQAPKGWQILWRVFWEGLPPTGRVFFWQSPYFCRV